MGTACAAHAINRAPVARIVPQTRFISCSPLKIRARAIPDADRAAFLSLPADEVGLSHVSYQQTIRYKHQSLSKRTRPRRAFNCKNLRQAPRIGASATNRKSERAGCQARTSTPVVPRGWQLRRKRAQAIETGGIA